MLERNENLIQTYIFLTLIFISLALSPSLIISFLHLREMGFQKLSACLGKREKVNKSDTQFFCK